MKKKILSIVLLVAANIAVAQVRVGIQGAALVSNPSIDGLAKDVKDKKWTFAPGLVLDFNLAPGFNFRPSLNYQTNDYSLENVVAPTGTPAFPALNTVNYITKNLQIPLDLVLPVKVGKNSKILLAAGPVVTLGLSGKYTITNSGVGSGLVGQYNIEYGDANAEIKKVDWGSNFGLGFRLGSKLDVMAKYKYGFTNQSNQSNTSVKQHLVSLTASYFLFGR